MNTALLAQTDPQVFATLEGELGRQSDKLELIASENIASPSVLAVCGSVFTNKYAEGYPGHRYYGGCEFADQVETLAINRAKKLFSAEHVNVQPHCGSSANMAAYLAVMKPGEAILGLTMAHGGHLTHGASVSFSGRLFQAHAYGVREDDGLIDYDRLLALAEELRPKVIVAGASSYPRFINFAKFREAADRAGAVLLVDMAHFAGLVAAGLYPSPIDAADIVTTTTHKTLRGPRGGMILCKNHLAKDIDSAIFPLIQGGPLVHIIAAKAVALGEALAMDFIDYQRQVVKNAARLGRDLAEAGLRLVSGGTDTHLLLLDLRPIHLTGVAAEKALDKAGITTNKNAIPFDPEKPGVTSGLRLGTPALTTRGLQEADMDQVAEFIIDVLKRHDDEAFLKKVSQKVETLCRKFPIYPGRH